MVQDIKPFGIRVWKRTRKRLAKKIVNQGRPGLWKRFQEVSSTRIGDLLHICTGFNARLISCYPTYIFTKRGHVLVDLDIETDGGNCSFVHCGVGPPRTFEEVSAFVTHVCNSKDSFGFADRYAKLKVNPDGTVQSKEI